MVWISQGSHENMKTRSILERKIKGSSEKSLTVTETQFLKKIKLHFYTLLHFIYMLLRATETRTSTSLGNLVEGGNGGMASYGKMMPQCLQTLLIWWLHIAVFIFMPDSSYLPMISGKVLWNLFHYYCDWTTYIVLTLFETFRHYQFG